MHPPAERIPRARPCAPEMVAVEHDHPRAMPKIGASKLRNASSRP
jgi:hypothetical protein